MKLSHLHRLLKFCAYTAIFCFFGINTFAANSNKVLIISSYGADYQWSNSIIDGINSKIKEQAPGIELNIEYLSSELFSNTENWKLKMNTILASYQQTLPLAIIFISDEAWMTYYSVNNEKFQNTPLLLCAVKPHTIHIDDYRKNIDSLKLSDFIATREAMREYNATGVLREMNVKGYISLMNNMIPDMDRLALVTDNRFYGIYTQLLIEEEVQKNYKDYPIEYFDARFIKTDSLLKRISAITPTTGVLLTSWLTGEHGFEYSKDYIYKRMSATLKTPIFITNDIGLEKGYFLGGYFNKADFWGEKTGQILLDIIHGKSPKDIKSYTQKDEQCYLNWNTLHKFNRLLVKDIPNHVVYQYRPESVFKKYKIQLWSIMAVFIVLIVAYIYTLQNHLKLRRAQKRTLQVVAQANIMNEQLLETRKNLIEALKKAKESDCLKSAFLANMSHEIRTPLNAIVGFSDLIVVAESNEERAESAIIIKRNSDLLLQLISDILDISKIESGTLDFTYGDTDLNSICNDVIHTLHVKCSEGVTISFVTPQHNIIAFTDQNRLMQVLVNLVNNAIKFTKQGGIELGYFPYHDDLVEFYVKDTGIGIPPEYTKEIFQRFVKVNTYIEGTGLGLPICKTIVGILGGEIGVESELNKGSKFWFRIKRRMA